MLGQLKEMMYKKLLLPMPEKYKYFNFFKDAVLNKQFIEQGYVVVDCQNVEVLDNLMEAYDKAKKKFSRDLQGAQFLNTSSLKEVENREFVEQVLSHYSPQLFSGLFRPNVVVQPGSFFTKAPISRSEVIIHQDGSHIDETVNCGIYAWSPLLDTGAENGGMKVLPKSHLLGLQQRIESIPWVLTDFRELIEPHLIQLSIKKGEILFFDHSLVHYSTSNKSSRERVVVSYSIGKDPYEYVYLHAPSVTATHLDLYAVDRDFWVDTRPTKVKIEGTFPKRKVKNLALADIGKKLNRLLSWLEMEKL